MNIHENLLIKMQPIGINYQSGKGMKRGLHLLNEHAGCFSRIPGMTPLYIR